MKPIAHRGRTIEAEVLTRATPQEAWEAWAEPEKLAGWFVDRATGSGRTGETMTWIFERFGMELPYRIIESVPGERIVFGPATDEMPPFALEVVISRHHGDTRIHLVNSGFSADADFDAQFEGIDSGWKMALGVLVEYLEHHFGKRRRVALALRPAEYDPTALRTLFTDPDALAGWLGRGAGIGAVGAQVALTLLDGGSLSGQVLADPGLEVAMSWSEIGGILELKAFRQGPSRMVGLRAWGWGMDDDEARALETRLEGWLDRLVGRLAPVAQTPG